MAGVKTLQAAIEAILFTMGESVELSKIAKAIEQDEQTTEELLQDLMKKYESKNRGIRIIELDKSYQMCTKKEMYDYLIRVAKQPKKYTLTDVLLETMSIIAYKQPITKIEVEKIRGVSCDHAINRLLEFNLIQELGRLDAPGRPLLFGTTEEFLRTFGVKSLGDLPTLNQEQLDDFKHQAEEEVQLKIDI
mgnify:CR=1 FL=1